MRYNLNLKDIIVKTFLFLCLTTTAFGQVVGENQIYEWDDFSGGLVTKLSPFSLKKSQGDKIENIRYDTELKSLSKRDPIVTAFSPDATEAITGLFRLYLADGTKRTIVNHGDEIESCVDSTGVCTTILTVASGDYKWQWLTWHDIAIGTDGVNQPVKYDGTSASATYLGSALATDKGSGTGPTGTLYNYKVSCYSATYESMFNQSSNSLTMTGNDITLTMIPVCPDTILGEDVVGKYIYRSKSGVAGTHYLLSNGDISNDTVTLTDSYTDAELTATEYPAGNETCTPPKGKFLVLHQGRLFFANNDTTPSRIYWSEIEGHDYFDIASEYFDIRKNDGDEITFVKNLLGKLTVSKTNTIQKIYTDGDTPSSDWAISDPFSFVGNQAHYSAVNTAIGVVYLGNNGIYNFNGQYSTLISDQVAPEIRDIKASNYENVWSEYYLNKYYMAYTSNETGSSTNDRVLIYDFLTDAYTKDLITINVFEVQGAGTDVEVLISGDADEGTIYAHAESAKEIIHRRHSDFTGTFDDMRYIPTGVGGVAEDPILELAWTETIDEMTGTIDAATGIIDRPDTNGTYVSQYLEINASEYDKIYWNESIPGVGGDVTFAVRSGATTSDTSTAAWSSEYTNPAGSDISSATTDTSIPVMQYRASLSTSDIEYTPNLTFGQNYVVRVTYDIAGSTDEASIPIQFRSGWDNLKAPGYLKTLKHLQVYYDWPESTAGTLTLLFETYEGESDTFEINLLENPSYYINTFTGNALTGRFVRMTVSEDSLNPIRIKKILVVYDVEPYVL